MTVTAAPTPPATPTGLTGTPAACGTGTINLTWNTVSGATTYDLRDGATVIYTGATASYSHTGLVAGSSHSYTVRATNAAGSSAYSSAVAVTAPSSCAQPDLTAAAPTPSSATVGTPLTFTSTVSNVGGLTTGASFNNRFRVATAANGGGTVSTLSVNSLATLGASANAGVTSSSYTFSSAGTYSVSVCADQDASSVGTITESNEGNNCSGWTNVTVANSGPAFDYTLSNAGNLNATKTTGTVNVQNTVTATLVQGTTQPVTITATGYPANVTVSYLNNPCNPTCSYTVQFAVGSNAAVGTYPIVVTGVSAATANKTTNFNLIINAPVAFTGSLDVTPTSSYIGQQVTWTCSVTGGTGPYTYAWTGTNFPTPAPTGGSVNITYQTTGTKTASAIVTDSLGATTVCSQKSLMIGLNPKFKEF